MSRAHLFHPDDATRFETKGFHCRVAVEFEAGAVELGLTQPESFDETVENARKVPGGRGENYLLASNAWPGRVRLRPLRHGGVLARWTQDRYFTPHRGEREFQIWQSLQVRGAPIPRIVLAASRRRRLFWNTTVAALNIEDTPNALEWLRAPDRSRDSMRRAAITTARSIRAFHDAGGIHGDLHLGNVLLNESGNDDMRCWIVDLDRAQLVDPPSARDRMRELMRLLRSAQKNEETRAIEPELCRAFLSAYCDGDRTLRRDLLGSSRAEERRLRRHRWGWRIGRHLLLALAAWNTLACSAPTDADVVSTGDDFAFSLLVTGDTGRSRSLPSLFEGQLAVARAMAEEDERDPVDGMILLGDNFYWHGLDAEHLVERIRRNLAEPYCHFLDLSGPRSTEIESACRVPKAARHPIPFYVVLGNHDLDLPESARLQREVVPEFLPQWRMSPTLATNFELAPGISLILFESEVAIEDRDAMVDALVEAIRAARGPWRIIATHRPIATDDLGGPPRGGYPQWVREAISIADRPVQLVLAGHHHSLQAFALEDPTPLLQIGAGSGSRAKPPLADPSVGALFGALELGFARIDRIGTGETERLAVSLVRTAPWPILSLVRPPKRLARFEVGVDGRTQQVAPDVDSAR